VFQITQAGVANFFYALNGTTLGLTGALSGTSATFSGNVTASTSNSTFLATDGTNNSYFATASSAGAYANGTIIGDVVIRGTSGISLSSNGGSSLALRIASTGAATFSSSVTVGGSSTLDSLKVGTTSTHQLLIGADSSYAEIQAITQGVGFNKNLILQRQGGNVGIGTSSPGNFDGVSFTGPFFDVAGMMQIKGTSANTIAGLQFGGTTFRKALIYSTIGTEDPALIFATASSGSSSSAAERMRITSGGDVGIGMTGVDLSRLTTRGKDSTSTNYAFIAQNSATTNLFLVRNDNVVIVGSLGTGLIYSNAGALTNTNPSDERLKDNINNIQYGLSDILKLRPVSYHWKDDKINQGVQFGFIAQEVQDVMPEAIKEFGNDVKYLGLEKDAIYATLVKAVQELEARIKQLENK
jgi:hypothetical protein